MKPRSTNTLVLSAGDQSTIITDDEQIAAIANDGPIAGLGRTTVITNDPTIDPIEALRARQAELDAQLQHDVDESADYDRRGVEQAAESQESDERHPEVDPGSAADHASTFLRFHADNLAQIEANRIAHENRYRTLTQVWEVDGVVYGLGLPASWPECQAVLDEVERHKENERAAIRRLQQVMKTHPLHPWVDDNVGVGLKQAARFIATIGDPADRLHVRLLYSYCGYGDPQAQRRRRGQQANWNPEARSRLHVVAESCLKQIGPPATKRRSKYRDIYDARRVKDAEAVHPWECPQCGSGERVDAEGKTVAAKHAPIGSPLTDGHKHARGLRAMKKAMLLDLWLLARQIRGIG